MKCVRCGAFCRDEGFCAYCGADLKRAKTDAAYLTDLAVASPSFRMLFSSARFALIANVCMAVVALFMNQILLPLPLLLSCVGILLLSRRLVSPQPDLPLSPAPGWFFTGSVLLRALSFALMEAVGISVCLGGRPVIERLIELYNQASGTDFYNLYNEALSPFGLSISLNDFYVAIYFAMVICMFIAGAGMILYGIGFMFFQSFRHMAKTNKVELPLLKLFTVTLLIIGIFNALLALFSADFFSLILYSTTAYLDISAFLCMRRIKAFLE